MKHINKEIALVFRISNFYLFYSFIVYYYYYFFALHVHAPLALCYVSTFRFDFISFTCLMSCKTGFPWWNIIYLCIKCRYLVCFKDRTPAGYFRTSVIIYMNMYFQISYSSRNYILYFTVLVCRKFDSKWRFHTARDAPGDGRRPPVPQVWKTSHGEG